MSSKIDDLLSKIKSLEQELIIEIQSQQSTFVYEVKQRRILLVQK